MKISLKIKTFFYLLVITLGNYHIAFSQSNETTNNKDTLLIAKKTLERPWTVSPFSIRVGAFAAISNMDIGAGSNNNPYSIFNFENALGMNRNTYSIFFNFNTRFRKHNRIDFSYYNIYRKVTHTLEQDIQFGDHTYPINSEVKAYLNTNIFRISYGYSLISNKHWDVGVLGGFHVMSFNTGLDLIGNTQQRSFNDDIKFTAPLPDFGAWGTYAFHDRWAVSAELSYFSVKIDNIKGRILNGNLAFQYKINKHWETDLGYRGYGIKINLDRKYLKSDFKWDYGGPFATVAYKFGHLH